MMMTSCNATRDRPVNLSYGLPVNSSAILCSSKHGWKKVATYNNITWGHHEREH